VRIKDKDKLISLILISPSILAVAIFVYTFIAWTGWVSLSKWRGINPNFHWNGFNNYIALFGTERFQIDLRNTLVFTFFFVGGSIIIGLVLAILLDQRIRFENIFRNIFLFPMAVSFIVTGVTWRWLLNPGSQASGIIGVNQLLHKMGLSFFNFGWYIDPTVWPGTHVGKIQCCIPVGISALIIAAIWQMSGYTMALYLAGLRGIPEELREAARVDGANEFQIYKDIVLPLLKPITLSAIIILGHISLKIFDLVSAMTPDGGPGFATDVPALYMWKTVFQANRYAEGAAIAIIMLVMVATLIIPYLINSVRTEVQQ
jgi:glucose/mannose transport system permease protein